MAGTRKAGEKIPLAVVGKDGIKEETENQEATMTDNERQTTIAELSENLQALRAQVDSLSGSLAEATGKAGKAMADTAGAAAGTVTSTVRTYPFYTVFAASAVAFLLGRLSAAQPETFSDRAYGQVRDALRGAGARIPSHLVDSLKSSLR
jgi:ElaB/YqjD/DUF883 family membrane-anchored ribosome-binding protein